MSGLNTEENIKRFREYYATLASAAMMSKHFTEFDKICRAESSNPVSMLTFIIERFIAAGEEGLIKTTLEYVEKHPLCSVRDISHHISKSESYTRRVIIDELVDTTLLERARIPSRTKPQSGYRITLSGFAAIHKGDGAKLPDYLDEDRKEHLKDVARTIARAAGFQNEDALYLQLMQGNTEELDSVIARLKLAALTEMDSYSKAGTKK